MAGHPSLVLSDNSKYYHLSRESGTEKRREITAPETCLVVMIRILELIVQMAFCVQRTKGKEIK